MVSFLTWYNAPFSMMIGMSFFFLMLQLIGGDNSDTDSDLDVDTDFDTDLDLDVDADIDIDIEADLDMGVNADLGGTKDLELDTDTDAESLSAFLRILGFVNAGRVPLSIILMSGFFAWGASGLLLNTGLKAAFDRFQPWFFVLSLGLGAFLSLFVSRTFSRFFGALFKDTTAATRPDDLVGCVGTIASGTVPEYGQKSFGRANVYSAHGTLLRVNCVTHEGCLPPGKHQKVFVTGYDPVSKLHTVLLHDSDDFHGYLSGHQHQMRAFEKRLAASQKALKEENT